MGRFHTTIFQKPVKAMMIAIAIAIAIEIAITRATSNSNNDSNNNNRSSGSDSDSGLNPELSTVELWLVLPAVTCHKGQRIIVIFFN